MKIPVAWNVLSVKREDGGRYEGIFLGIIAKVAESSAQDHIPLKNLVACLFIRKNQAIGEYRSNDRYLGTNYIQGN